MGFSLADLVGTTALVPTFADGVPQQVRATLSPGTLRTYEAHLRRLETQWAMRLLDEPTQADLEDVARAVQDRARAKLNSSAHVTRPAAAIRAKSRRY